MVKAIKQIVDHTKITRGKNKGQWQFRVTYETTPTVKDWFWVHSSQIKDSPLYAKYVAEHEPFIDMEPVKKQNGNEPKKLTIEQFDNIVKLNLDQIIPVVKPPAKPAKSKCTSDTPGECIGIL